MTVFVDLISHKRDTGVVVINISGSCCLPGMSLFDERQVMVDLLETNLRRV